MSEGCLQCKDKKRFCTHITIHNDYNKETRDWENTTDMSFDNYIRRCNKNRKYKITESDEARYE